MALTVEKRSLEQFRNPAQELGPFDGRVGCILEEGRFFITTPNQKFVPLPPLGPNRPLQRRTDCRYGDDDPTQWPQPFNVTFPHYSCIPRRDGCPNEQIMWWQPNRASFTPVVTGLGKLSPAVAADIDNHVSSLLSRVEAYLSRTPPARVPPPLGALTQMMKHSLSRLKSVAMTYSQIEVQIRDVQRSWLEVLAMMDYMEVYRPRMDASQGTVLAKRPKTAKTLGTFTSNLRVAQDHFQAGLPYWLIRPASVFSNQNILQACDPEYPHDIDLSPHVFRGSIIMTGPAGSTEKYNAIHGQARNFLQYPDPFSYGATTPINPTPAPQTNPLPSGSGEPAMSGTGSAQRRRGGGGSARGSRRNSPQHLSSQGLYGSLNMQGGGRNKFEPIDSPLMPLPIPSWQNALKAVNTDPSNLDPSNRNNPHDGKYLFPEPGIFAGVANDMRQARYFHTWRHTKEVCIFRVFQASSAAVPLSGQEWRNFLIGNLNNTHKGKSNQASYSQIRQIFADCLKDLGLDFDTFMPPSDTPLPPVTPSVAQKDLWELSELNFQFELLALDKRASGITSIEDTQSHQDMVSRCFPSTPALIVVEPSHANHGLGSTDWQDKLPYLLALRTLMQSWKGMKPTPLILPDHPELGMYRENDVKILEDAIARFYTQTFFNFFGRAAIIPTRLPL